MKISCADSNSDLCIVYVSSKICGEFAQVITSTSVQPLYQECSQCVVIKFLDKTFASLARKKIEIGSRFVAVFM